MRTLRVGVESLSNRPLLLVHPFANPYNWNSMKAIITIFCLALTMNHASANKPGEQVELSFDIEGAASVPYLFYLPKKYGSDSRKKWPVMLFLHGRGESRGPLSIVAKWGPPRMIKEGKDLPYIVISPQCPAKDNWRSGTQQAALVKLLDHVMKNYSTDPKRVYLTGLSMGGYGSWEMAALNPKRFAAVAPICGGGKPGNAKKLKEIPIWAWHGDADTVVPLKQSTDMVDAIKKAGGEKVELTTLKGVGHNSWSDAYGSDKLWDWFEKHKLP